MRQSFASRSLTRAIAVSCAAFGLLAVSSASTSVAAHTGASMAPNRSAERAAFGAIDPTFTLVRQTVSVDPEARFEAEVVIDNLPAGALAPPVTTTTVPLLAEADPPVEPEVDERALELFVTVHEQIRTRSSFQRSLEGSLGDPVFSLPPQILRGEGSRTSRTIRIPITAGPTAEAPSTSLRLTRSGVYPVKISLRQQTLEPVAELVTYLIRNPGPTDSSPPLQVATVIPVGAPPSTTVLGVTLMPDAPRLLSLINAISTGPAGQVPADLQINPETLGALFRLANPGDETADAVGSGVEVADVAAALQALGATLPQRSISPGPVVPIDISAWERNEFGTEVDGLIQAGIERLAFVLGTERLSNTWITDDKTSARALDALQRNGARQVVIPEDRLAIVDRSLTLTRPFVIEASEGTIQSDSSEAPIDVSLPAVMADAALSAHFPGEDDDEVLLAHRLLADLSVLFFDQPGQTRGTVVQPPEDWAGPSGFLGILLQGLASHPLLEGVTLDGLLASVEPADGLGSSALTRSLLDADPSGIGSLPNDIVAARERLDGFSSMLLDDDTRASGLRELLVVAASSDLRSAEQRSYIDQVNSVINDELSGVETPLAQNVTLTGDEGAVVVAFRNRNSEPLAVRVCLENSRLDFPNGNCRDVVLGQRSSDESFLVKARAAGTFRTDVIVTSPDGRLVIAEGQLTIRSSALSGVGVVLTVGAGAFLIAWWAVHWRRGRRDHRLVDA